jgi:protein involved in polysaccharide export with SLBB domain
MTPDSSGTNGLPEITMEDGDRFVVPSVPATVNVVGAVYDQNSFLYTRERRAGAYLQLAGGPNRDADWKREFLIRADGEVVSHDMGKGLWNNKFDSLHMYPGDTIVVPEKNFKPSSMRAVLEWSQLISNFAMSAAVIGILQ